MFCGVDFEETAANQNWQPIQEQLLLAKTAKTKSYGE